MKKSKQLKDEETPSVPSLESEKFSFVIDNVKILASLYQDKENFEFYSNVIKPEMFESVPCKDIFSIILYHYQKYQNLPGFDELGQTLTEFLGKNPKLPEDEYVKVLGEIFEPVDLKFEVDTLKKWSQTRSIEKILMDAFDLKKKDKPISEIIDKTLEGLEKTRKIGSPKFEETLLSAVEEKEVEWFWKDRIPTRTLSLIVGYPGVTKSYLTMMLTAMVTKGSQLPEEHWNNKPLKGSVIYLSAEDDPEFTIKKRVRLHGGDCSKVIIIGTTLDNYYMFNLNKDLKSLEEIVKRKGDIKLIVFDPLPAYLGVDFRFDSHKESHVRGVLAPITKFAEKHDLTVIGIMHLNKGDLLSVYRVSGSGAFVCAARSVSLVGEDKYDKGLIHFLPWKINLVKKPFGISYRIVNEMIKFEDFENKTTPEELLSQQERVEYPREDAKKFLMTVLGEGQVRPATEIVELSKLEGISRKTLDRAKQDLRIRSDEVYDEVEKVKRWVWFLPPDLVKKKEPQVVTDKK